MTKKGFCETIQRIMAGGNVRSSFNIHVRDIEAAVGRAVAALLKLEIVNVNFAFGSNIPPFQSVATYENITVANTITGRSTCTLPATPMALPDQMGVWWVNKTGCGDFIVPVQPGILSMAQGVMHTALSAMLGKDTEAYEPNGDKLTFNRTAEELGGTVDIKLIVMDILSLDEYSQLPIPQDMEGQVVAMVLKELQQRPKDDTNDSNDKP